VSVAADCDRVEGLLDALLDGELDGARAAAVRGHLRGCLACNHDHETRRALLEAARTLQPSDPPAALWQGIADRLDAVEVKASERPRLWWWWHEQKRRLAFGTLATVGACALLAMVARPWLLERHPGPETVAQAPATTPVTTLDAPPPTDPYEAALHEIARVDADYRKAIDELQVIVRHERGTWPKAVATSFDENLAVIDAAIARQRTASQAAPGDPAAQDALFASYQKQIDFLQEAVVRGEVVR
jgi:hypothetical protein